MSQKNDMTNPKRISRGTKLLKTIGMTRAIYRELKNENKTVATPR